MLELTQQEAKDAGTINPDCLIHGDCLEVMKYIPDRSIDCILCDPPYQITDCVWDSMIAFDPMWEQLKRIIKDNGAIVMNASQPFTTKLISSNMDMFKYCWVWNKGQGMGFLNAKKRPLRSCEDVCVFYYHQCTYNPQMRRGFKSYKINQGKIKTKIYDHLKDITFTHSRGDRYPVNHLDFIRDANNSHPTQKPVALMEYLIKTYTDENDTVLDFAMGSGTTGCACKLTNRKFIGIELDKEYYGIACKRIKHTPYQQSLSLAI